MALSSEIPQVPTGYVPSQPMTLPRKICAICPFPVTRSCTIECAKDTSYDTSRSKQCQNLSPSGLARPDRHNEGATPQRLDGPGTFETPPRGGWNAEQLYAVSSIHATPAVDKRQGGFFELVVSYQVPKESLVETIAYIVGRSDPFRRHSKD
jgi:hypothetical protein